jgi:hypothetical protein
VILTFFQGANNNKHKHYFHKDKMKSLEERLVVYNQFFVIQTIVYNYYSRKRLVANDYFSSTWLT